MNLALLAAASTGMQVGAASVASRFALSEVAPLTLAMLRYAIALLCLAPFLLPGLLARPRPVPIERTPSTPWVPREWVALGALGIGQFGLLIAALNYGLQQLSAARAALIFSLCPLLTLLLSATLGYERITGRLLGGVVSSIAGVAFALAPRLAAPDPGHWVGELAVLSSATIGAVCSVLYRPYLKRYPTLHVSGFSMLASVIFLAVAAWPESWPTRVALISAKGWVAVAFVGVSSAAGYLWWLYALKHLPATRVTIFLALNLVTAAVLGQVLLGEDLDRWTVGAVALISAGLWLATSNARHGARR